MTLPCKGTTVAMTQELEQPISVKPNLAAENGKPFRGFRMYLHNRSLIYSKMLRIIQDDNIRIIKKNSLGTTKGGRYTFPLKVPDAVGIIKQPFGCFMFLYPLC